MAVTGLTPGHQYEFRIYAENIYGRSDASATSGLVETKNIIKKEIKKKEYQGKDFIHNTPINQKNLIWLLYNLLKLKQYIEEEL